MAIYHKNFGYRASDFAEICGTTKRTLLYYDEIGLIKPIYTDDYGTRYYFAEQRMLFMIIQSLKSLGMSLREIKFYLDKRTPETLNQILLRQQEMIKRRKDELLQLEKVIDTRLNLLKENPPERSQNVYFSNIEEEYFILSEKIDSNDLELEQAILFRHLKNIRHARYEIGHPFAAMIHCDHLLSGDFDIYSYYASKIDRPVDDPNLHIKPAGLYAIAYLYGEYRNHVEIYKKMLHEIELNCYRCAGYSYKEGIIDEVADDDSSNYVTRISIRVFPAE